LAPPCDIVCGVPHADAGSRHLHGSSEELVRQKLRDPGSAEFIVLKVRLSDPSHSAIVCGTVNARNGFGGMSGSQRFVVGGTVALEDEIGAADMDQIWRQFCG
jgi:hypothetical protein